MKEFLKSISEYFPSFGRWAWVLLVDFLVAGAQIVADLLGSLFLPSWVWQAQVGITLVIAPLIAFHKVRLNRDAARKQLKFREWMRGLLLDLAQHRSAGVALRNQALQPLRRNIFTSWAAQVQQWHNDLKLKAESLSDFEAEVLRTLNWLKPVYSPGVAGQQVQLVSELNETLERLTELIASYRPILWQSSPGDRS
jgi:MFS family permease